MAKKTIYIVGIILNMTILLISLGFASFSSNLSIEDIEVAIRQEKSIRITNFYPVSEFSNISSYNVDSIHTRLELPNSNSEVTYKIEVVNISTYALQIENINVNPNNITYTLSDYNLGDNLCDNNKLENECNMGVKKEFYITFKYKENGFDPSNTVYNVDATFTWGYNYKINFHSNYNNPNLEDSIITQTIEYDTDFPLALNTFSKEGYRFRGWNTNPNGTGVSYTNGILVRNLSTDGRTIDLYAIWKNTDDSIYYEGDCNFNGQNNIITGTCPTDNFDYIDTEISLFSDENVNKNFLVSFDIKDVPDNRFTVNKRDTLVNSLYENKDNIKGAYPGFLLRIENNRWLLQGSNGRSSNKIYFEKNALINRNIKIIRLSNRLYYSIDNSDPYLLSDVTNLYSTFDTTLTFGASKEINGDIYRHSISTLANISFEFLDDNITLDEILGNNTEPEEETIFELAGPCLFNGTVSNISGDNCATYSNSKLINTNINLFDSTNYTKDFELSFHIDNYVTSNQEDSQVTIMNAFKERQGLGYGVLLRRSNNNLQLLMRDGNGKEKNVTIPSTTTDIKIVKKNDIMCYSLNNSNYIFALDYSNFAEPFDVPVTFGGSIDKNNNEFRYIKGILSDMKIKIGNIKSVICN